MSTHFTLPFAPIGYQADPLDHTGDNVLGIYTTEATQRYVYGTRLITWDGRVYKYCNAVAQVYSYWGAHAYENAAVSWTAVPTAGVLDAGVRKAIVTLGSRTTDDLAGGYLMTEDNSATTTTYLHGIVGNNDTATITTVYLDAPMPITTTTNDHHEVFENPYRETKAHGANVCPVICVPAQSSAAGYKYWGQTYGPAYISPTNSTIDDPDTGEMRVYFSATGGSGSAGGLVEQAIEDGDNQLAGFILNADVEGAGSIAGPLIMLQISI